MLTEINREPVSDLERVLFNILRKHGIFTDLTQVRNKLFNDNSQLLIRGLVTRRSYQEIKKSLLRPTAYTIQQKTFDNFITEYLLAMKTAGVVFTDGKAVDIVVTSFAAWFKDSGITIVPAIDEFFRIKIKTRFVTDR